VVDATGAAVGSTVPVVAFSAGSAAGAASAGAAFATGAGFTTTAASAAAAGFTAVAAFGAEAGLAAVAGFAAVDGFAVVAGFADTGAAFAVTGRPAEPRAATSAAAGALAAVAAFVAPDFVTVRADTAFAVVALAAFVAAAFRLAVPAALARAAREPVAPAVVLAPVVRRVRGAVSPASVVVWVDPERCAVPWRCGGTVLVAFSAVGLRDVPRAVARVEADPVVGSDPSARRRSWWSELMHLTSVGGHSTCTPGERSGAHVNTS
jgi:hypothetical protein